MNTNRKPEIAKYEALLKFGPYQEQFSPKMDKGVIMEEQRFVGGVMCQTPTRPLAKVDEEEKVEEEEKINEGLSKAEEEKNKKERGTQ